MIDLLSTFSISHLLISGELEFNSLPDEQRLFTYLFANYNRDLRPVLDKEQTIVVYIGVNLIQIFDLDEQNQVLIANCWIDMEWIDHYIHWNPLQFSDLEIVRVPSHLLWQPDIVLYNKYFSI